MITKRMQTKHKTLKSAENSHYASFSLQQDNKVRTKISFRIHCRLFELGKQIAPFCARNEWAPAELHTAHFDAENFTSYGIANAVN